MPERRQLTPGLCRIRRSVAHEPPITLAPADDYILRLRIVSASPFQDKAAVRHADLRSGQNSGGAPPDAPALGIGCPR